MERILLNTNMTVTYLGIAVQSLIGCSVIFGRMHIQESVVIPKGVKMEICPWCGNELEQGSLRSRGGNYFLPDGEKLPLTYSAHSMRKRGAIPLPPSSLDPIGAREWPDALVCRSCKKIIISYARYEG